MSIVFNVRKEIKQLIGTGVTAPPCCELLLGYAAIDERDIAAGIRLLACESIGRLRA
jgi:hypothetical protein